MLRFSILIFLFFNLNMKCQEKKDYVLSKFEKDSILNTTLYNNLKLENNDLLIVFDSHKSIILKQDKLFIKTKCGNDIIFSKELHHYHFQKIKEIITPLLEINPAHLNVQENKAGDKFKIEDSNNIRVNLFKNNKLVTLESYAPNFYIEQKVLFYKERETLLNAFTYLNSLFQDDEFKRIKSLDTLYIKIDSNDSNIKRVVHWIKNNNVRIEDIFITFQCSTIQLTNYYDKNSKKSSNSFFINNEFLKNNSNKIQDYEALSKLTMCEIEELLKTKKIIYLIDAKKTKRKRFNVIEVKGGTYCFSYP